MVAHFDKKIGGVQLSTCITLDVTSRRQQHMCFLLIMTLFFKNRIFLLSFLSLDAYGTFVYGF